MMETNTQIRLATTAIAAALAIAATPLLAQDAPPPDTSVDTSVTPTTDPLAPDPATDTSVAPETVAPEPTVAPVTPTTSEAAPTRSTKATASRRAAAAARPAPAPAETAVTPAPTVAAADALQVPPAAEAPPIEPMPPVTVEPAASRQMQMTAILSIVAAVLLGLVALAAAAFAIRRRRRRAAEVEDAEWQAEEVAVADAEPAMVVEPEPEPVRAEPAFVAAAAPAAAMAPVAEASHEVEGPVTELPEGFDLSQFGYNVQEAYKGPTEDNPSLSLKHRLRRASGMDHQERKLDAEVEAATDEPVLTESDLKPPAEAPAAKPAVADPAPGDFLLAKPGKEPVKDPARTH